MWILPSFSRPEQCAAVLRRIGETKCKTGGVLFLNAQNTAAGYFEGHDFTIPDNWQIFVCPDNIGALGAMNKVFELYPNENFYGYIADDEFVVTEGWDRELIVTAGDWDVSHGDDGFNNGLRAQGYLCIGGKLARAVGYLAIPEAWHWYGLDDMWEAMARSGVCEKRFVREVKVDHRHPMHGKGSADSCYDLGASRKEIDQQIYFTWLRHKLPEVMDRVRKAKARQ